MGAMGSYSPAQILSLILPISCFGLSALPISSAAAGVCDAGFIAALATNKTFTDKTDIKKERKDHFCENWRQSGSSSFGLNVFGYFGLDGTSSSSDIGSK